MFHKDITKSILFETDDLLIVNKPPMITSEKDNSAEGVSLSDIIKKYCPQAMLCHRLDKETSGVIIAAKNTPTYSEISTALEKRTLHKEYHCVIKGSHKLEEKEINLPIFKLSNYKAVIDSRRGKKATTIFSTLNQYNHFTLLKAVPISGRFHQIRIHLSSMGFPIIGDALYGGEPFFLSQIKKKFNTGKYKEETSFLERTALHAYKVSFTFKDKPLEVIAPYPNDFEVLVKLLEKYDSPKSISV